MTSSHELLEWIPDAVVVTDPFGTIVFANRKAESLTGYRRRDLVGRKVEALVPVKLRAQHAQHRARFYERGTPRMMGTSDADFTLRRKDGSEVSVEISLGPADTDTVAVIRDVTERRHMEMALEHSALHDPLTDLANRTLFFDRLRQAIKNARREGGKIALVMLDLDEFKAINDAYGHMAGDEVLQKLAARLRQELRGTDTAARIGGDEFALILPHVSSRRDVEGMVRRRLTVAQEPLIASGRKINLRVSAGIAIYPDGGRDVDTLLRNADAAMYSAKREGRTLVFHMTTRGARLSS
jgi:diguanylate cyclase (GGDEF)-like protein/PAS domain S-box-containing protein